MEKKDFFQWLSSQLRLPTNNFPDAKISNFEDFFKFFYSVDTSFVLLFDEFQEILNLSLKNDFFQQLKLLMDRVTHFQAVLAFGTYSLHEIQTEDGKDFKKIFSPFPANNTIYIPRLPSNSVEELFQEWANDRKVMLTQEAINIVLQMTQGNAGLISSVGFLFDSKFAENSQIDLHSAISQCFKAPALFTITEQFVKFKNAVQKDPFALRLVHQSVAFETLPFNANPTTSEEYSISLWICRFCEFGVFEWCFGSQQTFLQIEGFRIASPLMRQFILETFFKCSMNFTIPPNFEDLLKKPFELVCWAVQLFNSDALCQEEVKNRSTSFPSEMAFQAELFLVLRSAFEQLEKISPNSMRWLTLLEAKNIHSRARRADLLILDGARHLFELKAEVDLRNETLQRAVDQALTYARDLSCNSACIVNFKSDKYEPIPLLPASSSYPPVWRTSEGFEVSIIQFQVDSQFKNWRLF